MAQPLLATHRMQFEYVVDGVPHKIREWCSAVTTGSPGVYALVDRLGGSAVTASNYADAYIDALGNLFHNGAPTSMGWTLFIKTGPNFFPLEVGSHSFTGVGAPNVEASQLTMYFRDTAFNHIRVQAMESVLVPTQHYTTTGSLPSTILSFAGEYTPAFAGSVAAYEWVQSRSGLYLNASSFVAATTDFNDKLRRRRGLV